MPTGSGKTVVLIGAPFLLRSKRVLVLTPSRLVREQIAEEFESLHALRSRGILGDIPLPNLVSLRQRIVTPDMWERLRDQDVVVATPSTVSPAHAEIPDPPNDLFDLVLVDEAHHAEATTWRATLEHFDEAKQILFTATPFRRDRRVLNGRFIYTYFTIQSGQLEFESVTRRHSDDGV